MQAVPAIPYFRFKVTISPGGTWKRICMPQLLIHFSDVQKKFGNLSVLDGLNLSIYKGQITTLVGPQGGGKTVLLHHIAGLMQPDSGRILYKGQPLAEVLAETGPSRSRWISCIFRGATLFNSLTVFENIALPLRVNKGLSERDIQDRVSETIARLKLNPVSSKFPFRLSGETRKYVILARALVTGPEVVLFDQPTTGMDPIRKNAVHSVIADCQKVFNFTSILTSYDIPDVFAVSNQVALLESGKLVFQGSPDEFQKVDDPVVRTFIEDADGGDESMITTRRRLAGLLYPKDFALVILSIENMDEVREKLGDLKVEKALQKLSDQIQSNVRGADSCTIRHPDKIQIQLPHTDMEQSRQVCAKLAEAMKFGKIEAVQPGPGVFFSLNAGFAQARGDSPVEQVEALAESMQTPFYKFDIKNVAGEC